MQKSHVFYGIIAGVGCVAYYLLFYFIEKELFFHPGVYWSSWLPFLGIMLMAALRERSGSESDYSWRRALKACFTIFVAGSAIFQCFYYLFFNFGDPALAAIQQEVILENLQRYREIFGDAAIGQLEKGAAAERLKYDLGTAFQSFARSAIGGFIVSLALAFALKKE